MFIHIATCTCKEILNFFPHAFQKKLALITPVQHYLHSINKYVLKVNFERFKIAIIEQEFVKVINGLKFSMRRDLGRDEMRRHSHWTIVCSYLEHVAEVFERSTDVEMSQHVLIGT